MKLSTTTVDAVIDWAVLPMLAGIACWFAGFALSGMMLFGVGAMGGSMGEYRTEKGIWMLAALFLAIFGALYATFLFYGVVDQLAGRAPAGLLAIDAIFSTSILGFMVRFLWTVALLNRRVGSSPHSKLTEH